LTVEYDGTEFCGFQWQPAVRTVAGVLESALSRLFAEPVKVTGAGRTDSGVHATGQVVSFSTATHFPFERLTQALASLLPPDLSVREAATVEAGFSARFSAHERTYVYGVLNRLPAALLRRYVHHVAGPLDVAAMRAAAAHLVGEHDFGSFSTPLQGARGVRLVNRLQVESAGEFLRFEIAANGFLHRMVRTIVGTLLECGSGRRTPNDVRAAVGIVDRTLAGATAPAHGLYLAGVRYPEYDSFAEPPLFLHR
jgi:tRNA pseudouridine38-40 synthase